MGGRRRVGNRAAGSARPSGVGGCDRQIRRYRSLSRDGEGNYSTEVPDPTLPRKASSEEQGARTANRHR